MNVRKATPADAADIARIYNEGIEERIATFETAPRSAADVAAWFGGSYPAVVVTEAGHTIGFAATFPYSHRECYAGVAEFSVYVTPTARRRGAALTAVEALIAECRLTGFRKLTGKIFVENHPSRHLVRSLGFREVGVHHRHGQLDGVWRDVPVVEYLIEPPAP